MELHKLQILIGQIGPGDHGSTIPSASVRGCAREVGAPVAAGGEHRILGVEAMQRAILQAERDHAAAFTVLHQQIEGEILDKVVAIVAQRLAVKCVEQRMAGPVGHATTSMSLATLAELEGLTAEGTLIDLAWWKEQKWLIINSYYNIRWLLLIWRPFEKYEIQTNVIRTRRHMLNGKFWPSYEQIPQSVLLNN